MTMSRTHFKYAKNIDSKTMSDFKIPNWSVDWDLYGEKMWKDNVQFQRLGPKWHCDFLLSWRWNWEASSYVIKTLSNL